MARSTLALLVLLCGCFESHELVGGLDDGALDAGRRDFGTGRDLGRPDRDLGPPRVDAGSGCDRCISEVIGWGFDGGLVFERRWWELSPCDRLLGRVDFADGSSPEVCTASAGALDCGLLGRIEDLVHSAPMDAIRDAAPTVFGIDSRPVDGQILALRIGGDEIGVGADCGDAPDCDPVPPQLRDLADLLQRMADRASDPSACEPVMAPDIFLCGDGSGAPSCITGRDVCYLDRFESPRCAVPSGEEDMCSGAPSCDCLLLSLAESCTEDGAGGVFVRWVGP